MTKKRKDETSTYPAVLDPIEEGIGLFGKEALNIGELKIYLEDSRVKLVKFS